MACAFACMLFAFASRFILRWQVKVTVEETVLWRAHAIDRSNIEAGCAPQGGSQKSMTFSACIDTPMAMANQISYRLAGHRRISAPRFRLLGHAKCSFGLPRHKSASINALPATLQKRCEEWLALDQDPRSRDEAQQAIDEDHQEILQDRMGERLTFGGCKCLRCCCRLGSNILLLCRHSRLAWLDGLRVQSHERGCGAADHTGLLQLSAGACKGQA